MLAKYRWENCAGLVANSLTSGRRIRETGVERPPSAVETKLSWLPRRFQAFRCKPELLYFCHVGLFAIPLSAPYTLLPASLLFSER